MTNMLPIEVSLDRLVLLVNNVLLEEYDSFISKLQAGQILYPQTVIKLGMSSAPSAYRYNLNFGFGQGGIRVDYRHNSVKPDVKKCAMRIEFNPNKISYGDYEYTVENEKFAYPVVRTATPALQFFRIMNEHFDKMGAKNNLTGNAVGHQRVIRELDIAMDFPVHKDKIVVMNLTGKDVGLYKGTRYWGAKHTHGYLKKYDKKAERLKFKDKKYEKYDELTRLEYTMRFEGDVGINELSRIKDWEISSQYRMCVLDESKLENVDPTVKAYVLCYLNGLMEMKEFSRRYKEKTKTALEEMSQINMDLILEKQFKTKILSTIKKYIRKQPKKQSKNVDENGEINNG